MNTIDVFVYITCQCVVCLTYWCMCLHNHHAPTFLSTINNMHTTTQMNKCKAGGPNDASCHLGPCVSVRTEVFSSGPQGQRWPRAGVVRGGLDQKGSVHPTEVVK